MGKHNTESRPTIARSCTDGGALRLSSSLVTTIMHTKGGTASLNSRAVTTKLCTEGGMPSLVM